MQNKINHKGRKKRVIQELKGTNLSLDDKKYFFCKMPKKGWEIYSITAIKANVSKHLSTSKGKKNFYNYLTVDISKS